MDRDRDGNEPWNSEDPLSSSDPLGDVIESLNDDAETEEAPAAPATPEATSTPEAPAAAPEQPAPDTPAEETAPTAEAEPTEPAEGEQPAAPAEPASQPTAEEKKYKLSDGREVTGDELHELLTNWQAHYTRQRQEETAQLRQAEEAAATRTQLYTELVKDANVRAFMSKFPEAVATLLDNPESTRALVGNEEAVTRLWNRWEVAKDDPDLLAALTGQRRGQEAEARLEQHVEQARLTNDLTAVSGVLETVAAEFEGINPELVAAYVLERAGLTPAILRGEMGDEPFLAGLRRIQSLFVRPDGSVDEAFIRDRFELERVKMQAASSAETEKVTEHNAQVDKELAEAEGRPVPVPAGSAPAQGGVPEWKQWQEKIDKGDADMIDFLDSI